MTISIKQHSVGRYKIISNLGMFGIIPQSQLDGGVDPISISDKPPLYPGGKTAFLLAGMKGKSKIFSGPDR